MASWCSGFQGCPSHNLSAYKTQYVEAFLQAHPNVRLHFTPIDSSWPHQVELWFVKIERNVIAQSLFTPRQDLKRKLMRYIRHYNLKAKLVKWKYTSPAHRITSSLPATGN